MSVLSDRDRMRIKQRIAFCREHASSEDPAGHEEADALERLLALAGPKPGSAHSLADPGRAAIVGLAGSRAFYELMIELMELHAKKSHDYGRPDEHPLQSFTWIAAMAGVSVRQVFGVFKAVKQVRDMALQGRKALNESRQDTMLDSINYAALELAYQREFPTLYDVVPRLSLESG